MLVFRRTAVARGRGEGSRTEPAGNRGFVRIVLAAALLLVGAVPGLAHEQEIRDPRNGEHPLDLRKAISFHNDSNMFFYVETYAPWRASILDASRSRDGDLWMIVNPPGRRGNYLLEVVRRRDGYLGVRVDRLVGGDSYRVGSGTITDAGDAWIVIRVRRSLIEARNGATLGWYAGSFYTSSGICSNGCRDFSATRFHNL